MRHLNQDVRIGKSKIRKDYSVPRKQKMCLKNPELLVLGKTSEARIMWITGRTEGGRVRQVAGHLGTLIMERSLDYILIALGSSVIYNSISLPTAWRKNLKEEEKESKEWVLEHRPLKVGERRRSLKRKSQKKGRRKKNIRMWCSSRKFGGRFWWCIGEHCVILINWTWQQGEFRLMNFMVSPKADHTLYLIWS